MKTARKIRAAEVGKKVCKLPELEKASQQQKNYE